MSKQKRRNTKQRQVILEELRKVDTHPTADEIYERVRKRLPRVSLGTVYRNLDTLEKGGQIRRVGLGTSQKRFDGTVNDHYHLRCIRCQKVMDTVCGPCEELKKIIREVSSTSGFEVTGHQVEFTGLCLECQEAEKSGRTVSLDDDLE